MSRLGVDNPSMHWFWRATIAILGVCLPVTFLLSGPNTNVEELFWILIVCCASCLLLYAVITALSLRVVRLRESRETYCRKCNYILRGITEPRCPECGERI